MKILLIDNYDSFTFNLYQQLAAVSGTLPLVVYNDRITLEEINNLEPDSIVISPGPGHPGRARDFGICTQVLRHLKLPILGICLGHQGIAHLYGGRVIPAREPMHGRTSKVRHAGTGLFAGIPQEFTVVRYHSLAVSEELPDCLQLTAWTADGSVMGIRHSRLPFWGVQFHPESICTDYGDRLLENFLRLSRNKRGEETSKQGDKEKFFQGIMGCPAAASPNPCGGTQGDGGAKVYYRQLASYRDAEQVFVNLFADEPYAFWLDSSLVKPGLSRFSFMGAANGPHSYIVNYSTWSRRLTLQKHEVVSCWQESIFDFLRRELDNNCCQTAELPFDFNCGFVGYFGYELKCECGGGLTHLSHLPDAAFLFVDRALAFDHEKRCLYLLALEPQGQTATCEAWFDAMEERLRHLRPVPPIATSPTTEELNFSFSRDYNTYLADIAACLKAIRAGDSYEVCLTNQLRAAAVAQPLAVYRTLRRLNPAPFAAFFRFGEIAVLSASPEQFLKIDQNRWVTAKPIKGTLGRGQDFQADRRARQELVSSEKNRAENLMIVDLLRNDLGKVCEIGSITVPKLMDIESYATVHQMVSTIQGRLKPEMRALDCIRAAFPGGSMTGAPKIRTMEIIDRLETEARGIYSGSLGYLSLNGSADLNIVIRTAISTPTALAIGVGGAIVALSEPNSEFEETCLKAKSLIQAVVQAAREDIPLRM